MARFVAVAQHFWQRLLDGGHRMTSMFPHVSSSFLEKMLSFTTGLLGEPRSDWTSRSQMTQSSNTKPKDPKGSQRPKARPKAAQESQIWGYGQEIHDAACRSAWTLRNLMIQQYTAIVRNWPLSSAMISKESFDVFCACGCILMAFTWVWQPIPRTFHFPLQCSSACIWPTSHMRGHASGNRWSDWTLFPATLPPG
jgi:hypothetical protein